MSLEARVEEQILRYSQHKSYNSAVVVKVRFFNLCKDPIQIWWLNYEGEKVQYFGDVTIVPGHRCDMHQTFLTHPWVFTNETTGEPVYAQYSSDKRQHFEVLRFVFDKLKNGKIDRNAFQRQVQGMEFVDVGIVGPSSLYDISASVIAKLLLSKCGGEESDLEGIKEATEGLELAKSLKKDVISTYNKIKRLRL